MHDTSHAFDVGAVLLRKCDVYGKYRVVDLSFLVAVLACGNDERLDNSRKCNGFVNVCMFVIVCRKSTLSEEKYNSFPI